MRHKRSPAKATALSDAVRDLVEKKKQQWARYVGQDAQAHLKSDAFPYIGAIPIHTFWNARGRNGTDVAEEKALVDLIVTAGREDRKKKTRRGKK